MNHSQKILHLLVDAGFDETQQLKLLVQAQLDAGSQITLLELSSRENCLPISAGEGVLHRLVRCRWPLDPFAVRQAWSVLHAEKPDVVHLWGPGTQFGALVAKNLSGKVPLLATLSAKTTPAKGFRCRGLQWLDQVVVDHRHFQRQLESQGLPAAQISVIPPAVEPFISTAPSRGELLEQLELPADSRLIVVAAPLERSQAIDDVIWCFELIRTLHESACLLIVGSGPERQRLERFTRLVSEPKAIRFLHSSNNLTELLSQCNVCWQLGQSVTVPGPLLLSMAAGTTVVASDIPAHRALIKEAVTGYLVPSSSRAMLARRTDQLLHNQQLASDIGQAASQDIAKRFSVPSMVQAYNDLYGTLTKSRQAVAV